ncbi:Glutamyl-tRNA reductase 1, chloroplastic [Hordeum vulgare]|nr:Glutamyl-tRNA reductase 1, chloroplastic [Hordeum vulgare]
MKLESMACFVCGRGHLFIKCKAVKEAWRQLGLEQERRQLESIRDVHAMLDSLWGLAEKKRVLIITFWWHWWNNRNRIREGDPSAQPTEIVRRARCDAMEYAEILGPAAPKRKLDRWQPPRDELIKINLDGAFTPGNSYSGWGIAARDAHGTLLVARAGRKEQVTDAFGAELHALAVAVTTATEIGAIRVIFETGSQLLVEAMDVSRADASPYAVIIEDLKYQLKIWFAYWNITSTAVLKECFSFPISSMLKILLEQQDGI